VNPIVFCLVIGLALSVTLRMTGQSFNKTVFIASSVSAVAMLMNMVLENQKAFAEWPLLVIFFVVYIPVAAIVSSIGAFVGRHLRQ
jgi:hypothetical protein